MENVGLIFETKYKDKKKNSYYKLLFYLVGSKFNQKSTIEIFKCGVTLK